MVSFPKYLSTNDFLMLMQDKVPGVMHPTIALYQQVSKTAGTSSLKVVFGGNNALRDVIIPCTAQGVVESSDLNNKLHQVFYSHIARPALARCGV